VSELFNSTCTAPECPFPTAHFYMCYFCRFNPVWTARAEEGTP
jgi:hypothetical protein